MRRSLTTLAAAVILFSSSPAAWDTFAQSSARAVSTTGRAGSQRSAGDTSSTSPQRSANITLDDDPATQGSAPYKEAVRRFLRGEEPKIVGGKVAPDGAYPWQVSLGVSWITDPYRAHFCGGSIHSDKWIITAAHCTYGLMPSQIAVTAGTNRLAGSSTRRNVRRIIVHKNYNDDTTDNDISLLELQAPLPLSDLIKAVPLMAQSAEGALLAEGAPLVVTGWGATVEGGNKVRDLRYLDGIPFVPRVRCNRPLAYDGRVTNNMFCAGFEAGGGDSCQGDSGGPITVETATAPKLAGIVSWGDGCARPNKVGIYTRLVNYLSWIGTCVSNSPDCNQ